MCCWKTHTHAHIHNANTCIPCLRSFTLTPGTGNKIDLVERRTRHHTTFVEQAKEWGLLHYSALEAARHVSYITVSAQTGEHIDTLVEKLVFLMPDTPPPMPKDGEHLQSWCALL